MGNPVYQDVLGDSLRSLELGRTSRVQKSGRHRLVSEHLVTWSPNDSRDLRPVDQGSLGVRISLDTYFRLFEFSVISLTRGLCQ